MELKKQLEYVRSLIVEAINNGDVDAIVRYHAVMYFLYIDLIAEQQKEIIKLRKAG
jgi:hypothetical protein